MSPVPLSDRLGGRREPRGYVSFRSALVHHGALLDGLTRIQIASPDCESSDENVQPGPADFMPIPRDLYFGWESTFFEGTIVPVATPEKALLDWLYWCEERGHDPRIEELEWECFSVALLDVLATRTGISYRPLVVHSEKALAASHHDQQHLRQQTLGVLAQGRPLK